MTFKAGTAAKYVGEWWRRGDLLVSPCARTKASRLALLPERVGEWWKKDWSADSAFWPKADPARFLQIHSEIDLLVMPLPVQKLQGWHPCQNVLGEGRFCCFRILAKS
jgi:hypothetical protein